MDEPTIQRNWTKDGSGTPGGDLDIYSTSAFLSFLPFFPPLVKSLICFCQGQFRNPCYHVLFRKFTPWAVEKCLNCCYHRLFDVSKGFNHCAINKKTFKLLSGVVLP